LGPQDSDPLGGEEDPRFRFNLRKYLSKSFTTAGLDVKDCLSRGYSFA
jgi:hypothetical protein